MRGVADRAFRRAILSVGLLLTIPLYSKAQTVTRTEQAACAAHHVQRWCGPLALDFSRRVLIVQPLSDPRALGADMAPRALRMTLESAAKSALKTQAEQAGQRALQAISVAGAVNQTTGTASTSGSTDLAAKPTTTDFLSIAEATGGFTQTQNGSAVTLQANALGMTKYLRNEPVFARINSRAADWLQPLTVTVTVNLAQAAATFVPTSATSASSSVSPGSSIASVLLPATNATLNSVGANYALYRRYSPQDKKFAAAWKAALLANQTTLAKAGSAIASAVNAMLSRVTSGKGLATLQAAQQQWASDGAAAERSGDFVAFAAAYERYRDAVEDLVLSSDDAKPATAASSQSGGKTAAKTSNAPEAATGAKNESESGAEAVNQLNLALEVEQEATWTVLNQARGKPLATASYLYTTPTSAPATHSATLSLAEVFPQGAQITGNFTAEMYASLPRAASYGRLRDVQLAAELDYPLGGTVKGETVEAETVKAGTTKAGTTGAGTVANPRATVSLAGYGQYQYSPSVLNVSASNVAPGTAIPVSGQVLAGAAGWLGVAQGKLTLHLRQGLDLPLAIKWSNRTELLNSSDVRGQFGLSFDLSALSRLIGSS